MRTIASSLQLLAALAVSAPGLARADAIDRLAPGEWYQVPSSHMRTVVPVPTPVGVPASIMGAWSGGAYDTQNDRLLVWGGGHGDYGGNEIYAFSTDSLRWSRIWGPSPLDVIQAQVGGACVPTYSDGNPVSRHTYGGLSYVPGLNIFLAYGGSLFCPGGWGYPDLWAFDLNTLRWTRKADLPVCSSCGDLGAVSAYDPVTGHVWLAQPAYTFHEYNPATNQWTLRYDQRGVGNGMSGAIDTRRHKFVVLGLWGVRMFDLNQAGTIVNQAVTTTGDTGILGTIYPGVAYDPVSDRIVAWDGGASVYTLNMDTLVWTRRDPAATNTVIPTGSAGNGTYGRFQYIASRNAFIGVNDIDEDVYIYKLSPGSGNPAPVDSIPPSAPDALHPR